MKKLPLRIAAAALVATTVAACGARTGLPIPEPAEPSECVSLNATAAIAGLDVFIMMDSSGSMTYPTAQGASKWQAVRDALASFLLDPDSSGVGVAISFFPEVNPSVPTFCTSDPVCGVADACHDLAVCWPGGGVACDTSAECAALGFPNDTCVPVGICEKDETLCLPDQGLDCDPATQGACLPGGYCENRYECAVSAYEDPIVDVASLPGASSQILQAIDNHYPDGGTTTLPALQGVIASAAASFKANPDHKAIVVLATDGFPTQCDPALDGDMPELAIAHLAETASAGVASGVQTFVIGVFGPDEQATAAPNLDAIAKGGDTEAAFLINTDDDVTERFREALNSVRLTAKSCEFAIPLVSGAPPDTSRMTVHITPTGDEATSVDKRASAAACDPETGGFYYDQDPDGPVPPTRVILCPATCDLFGPSANRTVDLRVSCD